MRQLQTRKNLNRASAICEKPQPGQREPMAAPPSLPLSKIPRLPRRVSGWKGREGEQGREERDGGREKGMAEREKGGGRCGAEKLSIAPARDAKAPMAEKPNLAPSLVAKL